MASISTGEMSALHDLVRELEKERESKIWCMLHCGGGGHICGPTMWSIIQNRDAIGTGKRVELLIHSGGGHPDIAYRVMKFFRRRFQEVNIIVPLTAKSAATIMCLGADKIYFGELADLGPIDIQIDDNVEHGRRSFSPLDEFKSLEFLREQALEWMDYYAAVMNMRYGLSIKESLKDSVPLVTAVMRPVFEQIDPVEMGGYRRAIAIGEEYAKRMLALTGNPSARQIIRNVVWGYPSHDFCIDYEEAEQLGLPVERLPVDQDRKLTAAILAIEEDTYHGFVPQPPPPQQPSAPESTKSVRKATAAKGSSGKRVNGSGGSGQKERVGSEGPAVGSPTTTD
jgi:hypothetical protein